MDRFYCYNNVTIEQTGSYQIG